MLSLLKITLLAETVASNRSEIRYSQIVKSANL